MKDQSNDYEAIVVGAGPAGSSAARRAAELGVKVLVVDRRREIGNPVQCGELLPTVEEFDNLLPKAQRVKGLFALPEWLISNRCSSIVVYSPSKKVHEFSFGSLILDRRRFDKWLSVEACEAGADLWTSCTALSAQEGGKTVVVKKDGELISFNTEVMVAADGSGSKMVQDVGLAPPPNPYDDGMTMEYEMARVDVDPSTVEVYFGKEFAPGGYAWIIPKGEGVANVGVGMRTPYSEKGLSLKDYLGRFITHPLASKKLERAVVLSTTGGLVPMGGPLPRTYLENVIVVGDAARQTMASNGGGIPTAVICGDIGGEAVAHKVKEKGSLALYEEGWKKEVGEELEASIRIRRIGDVAMRSDRLTEILFERFSGFIEDILRCRLPKPIDLIYKTIEELKRSMPI